MEGGSGLDTPIVYIYAGDHVYTPVIAGSIVLESSRAGAPGRLSFRVVKDDVINFHEGDRVTLAIGGVTRFSGIVFVKRRQGGGIIQVTAYDQLRYLKNRDTYVYENLTATELVRRVCNDTGLICGALADTGYMLSGRMEDGKSLLDILQTALDQTAAQTGRLYVLYDDGGQVRLSHVPELALDTLIHQRGIGDFDYTSSIDRNSYSAIKLHRRSGDDRETEYFTAVSEALVTRWGFLQYYAGLEEDEDGPTTAAAMLALYGRRTRHLRITDAVGDVRVRGGSLLPVELSLGDMDLREFLLVERVSHTFSEGGHLMDLTLIGGEFVD